MHEKRFHRKSSFITLTYDQLCQPSSGSLVKKDFQDFIKRTRKHYSGDTIRYFHCGEYGEERKRPHYHAIMFGVDFLEEAYNRRIRGGNPVWHSKTLDKLWGKGRAEVGTVTTESCGYVARYVTKKITGDKAEEHYSVPDANGEYRKVEPEYATMSRRPGIGALHFEKFWQEIYPVDEIIVNGKSCKPPKFYDRLLEKNFPEVWEQVKTERERALVQSPSDRTPERLEVREVVKRAQIQSLRRDLNE